MLNRSLLPLLLVLVAGACGENPADGSASAGEMWGRVGLTDDLGNVVRPDGVTVSLLGTDLHGVSDTNGIWTIEDVPAGVYTLSWTKPGFAEARLYNQQFVGTGSYYTGHQYMEMIPRFGVTGFRAYWLGSSPDSLRLEVEWSETMLPVDRRRIMVFFDWENPDSLRYREDRVFDYNLTATAPFSERSAKRTVAAEFLGTLFSGTFYLQAVPMVTSATPYADPAPMSTAHHRS